MAAARNILCAAYLTAQKIAHTPGHSELSADIAFVLDVWSLRWPPLFGADEVQKLTQRLREGGQELDPVRRAVIRAIICLGPDRERVRQR